MHYSTILPVVAGLLAALVPETAAAAVKPVRRTDVAKSTPRAAAAKGSYTPLVPFSYTQSSHRRRSKRNTNKQNYALASKDTWHWSLNGAATPNAALDCAFEDAQGKDVHGKSVGIERLMDDIDQLVCSDHGLTIKFKDQQSYNTAKANWNWVHGKNARYIAMVVHAPQCFKGSRQPYKIFSYKTDDSSFTINAAGPAVDFKDAFPVMNLQLAGNGISNAKSRRAFGDVSADKQFSIPLAHDFSTSIFSEGGVSLNCGNCNTAGNLNVDANVKFSTFSSPHLSGTVSVTPSGISATVGLDLSITAQLAAGFSKDITFLNVGLPGGISIPAIGNIGPSLSVNMDANIGNVEASVDLSLGSITMSIDDNSQAVIDFNDGSNDQLSGFTPSFSTQGPSINGAISVTAHLGMDIVLGLEAELFNEGVAVGLAIAAPTLDGTASISTDGSCPGIELDAGISAQLNAFGGFGNVADVAAQNTISIIGTSTQIFSTCLTGFPGATSATATPTPDPSAPSTPTPTPDPSAPSTPTPAPPAPQPSGFMSGTLSSTLSDAGCQALGASSAADICSFAGGDSLFTTQCGQAVNLCCSSGTACTVSTGSDGTTGICCF